MPLYYVEGNIGSWKSTLLKKLAEIPDIELFQEPVNMWTDVGSYNLLDMFYTDPKRFAYLFQSYVFKTRVMSTDVPQMKEHRVCERSIATDVNIFGKQAMVSGDMLPVEAKCYNEWLTWLTEKFYKKPDGIIYLRTSPEKCLDRIVKRGRGEEVGVSLSYLEALHKRHDEWLLPLDIPTLVIDNDEDDGWDEKIALVKMFMM
jgi:deoxyadenosine/deoxycytidine kinase